MRLVSSKESVEQGEPSWLAIIETLLATGFYWGIAWHFDTYQHLLLSILIVPLLLLRSTESAKKGAIWFAAYLSDKTEITPHGTPLRFWGVLLPLILVITTVCAYMLAQSFLPNHTGWSLFVRAMLLGVFAMWVSISIAVAGAVAGAVVVALLVALVLAMAVAEAGVAPAALGLAMTVTLAAVLAVAVTLALMGSIAGEAELLVAVLLAGIPWIFGIWLRSLLVRIIATLRHPLLGLQAMPGNWCKTIWVIDSRHPPKLVPGSESLSSVFSPQKIRTLISSHELFDRLFGIALLLLFFFPVLFYRWTIKSSSWFYWPLIYLLSAPERQNSHAVVEYISSRNDGYWELLRRWLALLVFFMMIATTFSPFLKDSVQNILPYTPARLYLYAFDLSLLALWQWCSVSSILFTGLIYAYRAIPIRWLLWLVKIRSLSSMALLLLSFSYTWLVLSARSQQDLPGWPQLLHMICIPCF